MPSSLVNKKEVQHSLSRALRRVRGATGRGLINGALLIKAVAQTKTPVLTGNLKTSAYIADKRTGFDNFIAQIGFTAEYATKVHEDLETEHKNGEAKFLENAVNETRDKVLRLVQTYARVR